MGDGKHGAVRTDTAQGPQYMLFGLCIQIGGDFVQQQHRRVGGGGAGKTTTINAIIRYLESEGLDIRLAVQTQMGADIVADAVAALEIFQAPIITIDMGTATTIGVISEGRTYEGGMLLPGVNVSLEALSRQTAQLPAISLQAPKTLIGKTTEECMRSGIVYGTAAMLDGLIDRIREEFPGKTVNIVATGGSAPFIVKFCRNKILYDKTLLMKGLWAIYQRNQ